MEIIDFLESLISIFFYDIKQKERSVFILVDNIVEVSCKSRLRERKKQFGRNLELDEILKSAGIGGELKRRLLGRRKERNSMQHELVAVTVTTEHCADAIMDLCKLLKRLWGKYAFDGTPEWLLCSLRIIKLYSRIGDAKKRNMLENLFESKIKWNEFEVFEADKIKLALEKMSDHLGVEIEDLGELPAGKRLPKDQETIIWIGSKKYWTILIKNYTLKVSSCMDELNIDYF